MDARSPRDGKVIEELGHYDPMVRETDARAVLKKERVDYWLSVGAQPSDKVAVLIRKYGSQGTRLDAQQAALERTQAATVGRPRPWRSVAQPAAKAETAETKAPAVEATGQPG